MTVIYVRHGDDGNQHPNYSNDPSLTPESYWAIKKFTWRLLQEFGRPDAIYVSPMRRAWETALVMEEVLHQRIPLIVDPHLSRYFTHKEKDPGTVRPDTLKRKVPISESKREFRARVIHHIDHLSFYYSPRRPLIWCITHALVMKRLGKAIGRPLKGHLDFLETLVVDKIEASSTKSRKGIPWRGVRESSRTAHSRGGSVVDPSKTEASAPPATT